MCLSVSIVSFVHISVCKHSLSLTFISVVLPLSLVNAPIRTLFPTPPVWELICLFFLVPVFPRLELIVIHRDGLYQFADVCGHNRPGDHEGVDGVLDCVHLFVPLDSWLEYGYMCVPVAMKVRISLASSSFYRCLFLLKAEQQHPI